MIIIVIILISWLVSSYFYFLLLLGNGGKFAPGSPAMSAAVKANLAAFIHNQQANSVRIPSTINTVNHPNTATFSNFKNIVLCPQPVQAIVEKPRANSLPNGFAQQKLVWYVFLFFEFVCVM